MPSIPSPASCRVYPTSVGSQLDILEKLFKSKGQDGMSLWGRPLASVSNTNPCGLTSGLSLSGVGKQHQQSGLWPWNRHMLHCFRNCASVWECIVAICKSIQNLCVCHDSGFYLYYTRDKLNSKPQVGCSPLLCIA